MTEEIHIPTKAAEPLVLTITPPVAQDNWTPSISERDNSYKENIDVLQTDKPQQELSDIRKDSKTGFFGFSFTKKNADKYKMEIEKIKHEAEMKHHKQLSSVEQKFKSQITQLENRVVSQSTCIENLERSLAKTEIERASLKAQLEKKSSEKISLEKENENIKHEAEMKLHMQLSSVEQKLQLKSTCIENLESSLAKTEAEKNSFKDQLEKKERSDKEKSEEIKRLQISLTKAETERNSQRAANKNHEALMSRISQLENAMKAKDEENLKISGDVRRILMENSGDLRGLHVKPTEMTLRAKFLVSTLTSEHSCSKKIEFAIKNWCVTVCKEDGYLALYVQGTKMNESSKPCSAFFDCKLFSQKTESEFFSRSGTRAHDFVTDTLWGWKKFISIKDLFDEEKGYVKDDSILVAADVRVFPTV